MFLKAPHCCTVIYSTMNVCSRFKGSNEITRICSLTGLLYFISSDEASLIEFILFSVVILSYSHSWKTRASILSTISCRPTWARGTWTATFTRRALKKKYISWRKLESYSIWNCLFKLTWIQQKCGMVLEEDSYLFTWKSIATR